MTRFASELSDDEIIRRLVILLEHKVVREIDGLLNEYRLRNRNKRRVNFRNRILNEMSYLKQEADEG